MKDLILPNIVNANVELLNAQNEPRMLTYADVSARVDECLVDLNGTQAAIRAGYSDKSARVNGPRLLSNADVLTRVDECLVDLNATQAAVRAGYKKNYADRMGYKLVENSRVSEAIQEAMKEREKRTEVTQDMVIEQLAKIAFLDIWTC